MSKVETWHIDIDYDTQDNISKQESASENMDIINNFIIFLSKKGVFFFDFNKIYDTFLENFLKNIVLFHIDRLNLRNDEVYASIWGEEHEYDFNYVHMHFDHCDYENVMEGTKNKKPIISCVTFFNENKSPLIVTDITKEMVKNNNYLNDDNNKLYIEFPKTLKHVSFNGGAYLHGESYMNMNETCNLRKKIVIAIWKKEEKPKYLSSFDMGQFKYYLWVSLGKNIDNINFERNMKELKFSKKTGKEIVIRDSKIINKTFFDKLVNREKYTCELLLPLIKNHTNDCDSFVLDFTNQSLDVKSVTICLAIICKNESHCILDTLNSCYKLIDYWVICDTGSTDDTCSIIENFFREKKINGELHRDKWVGFGYNKTLMFERCYKKTDFVIHPDADDIFVGNLDISLLNKEKHAYNIQTQRGGVKYKTTVIWNNEYRWKICGVAHTIARCLDCDKCDYGDITNTNFMLISRDTGSRSKDEYKYYKDALLLQDQFIETVINDEYQLNGRSVFYTAQSYYDNRYFKEALLWYSMYTKHIDSWDEEIYESYLKMSECMIKLDYEHKFIIECLEKCISIFNDRAEAFYYLGSFYYNMKNYYLSFINLSIAKSKNIDFVRNKYSLFIHLNTYGNNSNMMLLICCTHLKYREMCIQILKEMEPYDDIYLKYIENCILSNKI